MKCLKSKKAQGGGVLVVIRDAVLVLFVIFILLFIFNRLIRKEAGQLAGFIDGLDDFDDDGTVNAVDPCPCDPDVTGECSTKKAACTTKMGEYYKELEKAKE